MIIRRGKKKNMVLVLCFLKMRARVWIMFLFTENFLLVVKHRFIIERQGMCKI